VIVVTVVLRQDFFLGSVIISGLPMSGATASGPNTLSGAITGAGATYSFPPLLDSGYFMFLYHCNCVNPHALDLNTVTPVNCTAANRASSPLGGTRYTFATFLHVTGANATFSFTLPAGVLDTGITNVCVMEVDGTPGI